MLNSETQNSGPAIGPTSSQIIEVFTLAQSGLVAVEDRLLSCFRSDAPELTTISTYLMQQGGKRIRPVLALLSARLFGMNEPSTALVDVAAGIELIHMATLLHDDIIDESPVRRHKRSAYLEFGLPPSLLTGDFLLVRAFGLCALLDDFVVQRTEQACVELVEGEILEGKLTPSNPASFPHYLNVVSKKTASLFALACELGGHQAGVDAQTKATLREFGLNAGIAFQMVDDILDITADEDLLGKPSGTDLKQRSPSLVNILWLASGDKRAADFFAIETSTLVESQSARDYLRTSEILGAARHQATEYAKQASEALLSLSDRIVDQVTMRRMLSLVEYTLNRCL